MKLKVYRKGLSQIPRNLDATSGLEPLSFLRVQPVLNNDLIIEEETFSASSKFYK